MRVVRYRTKGRADVRLVTQNNLPLPPLHALVTDRASLSELL
jgi:hypothetical protein